jgi:hypothetical protein
VFQQRFRQCRIVREVGEGNLGLDHPELGEVAAGVRVLGAEGLPERIDLGECEAVGLDIELARDFQERLAAEEILREIDLAVGARQVGEIEGRDPERGPRPLYCVLLCKLSVIQITINWPVSASSILKDTAARFLQIVGMARVFPLSRKPLFYFWLQPGVGVADV